MLAREREIYRERTLAEGKPEKVVDKIVEGRMEKFFSEAVLLEQPFIKDAQGKTTVKDLVASATAKTGERIVVRRFVRYTVGE